MLRCDTPPARHSELGKKSIEHTHPPWFALVDRRPSSALCFCRVFVFFLSLSVSLSPPFCSFLGEDLEGEVPRPGAQGIPARGDLQARDVLLVGAAEDVCGVRRRAQDVVAHHGPLRVTAEDQPTALGGRDRREPGVPVREGVPVVHVIQLAELTDLAVGPEVPDPDGAVLRARHEGLAAGWGQDRDAADVPAVAGQGLDAPLLGAGADIPQLDGPVGARSEEGVDAVEGGRRDVGLVLLEGVDDRTLRDIPKQRGGVGGGSEDLVGRVEELAVCQVTLVADQLGLQLTGFRRVDRAGVIQTAGRHELAGLVHGDTHDVGRLESNR
mmetsp:Transcript_9083/g.22224  ORF Transcript_9083/g.22224 Transcript_9083/m.22224 type:complete len:326 (-) Transcript_9083:404-1381(-)